MTTTRAGSRAPCLVGTARHTWHPGVGTAPEPIHMWEMVARAAAADAGVDRDVIGAVDDLGLVHCQSWAYDDPAGRLAQRLGRPDVRRRVSLLAGTSPQRLLNAAAGRMLRGESEVALVVGGEALAARRAYRQNGEVPPWSHPHPDPPALPVDLDQWYLPTEVAHGVLPAWLTFALLEQARWAARGATAADRDRLAGLMAGLTRVAAATPDAWFRTARTAGELARPAPDNRMVATPYTKRMTAFMDVDMAAANLLVTRATADAWGVPEDRRVYLRGWGFDRDAVHLGARQDLASSPAMRSATAGALAMAGMVVDQVDVFDLYSCFGSAVQFAQDALGLHHDDPRPVSLTGGLPYHGGPSSNYMGHSVSHVVDHLRSHPGRTALVTGVGMHMTKHVAAVWSSEPGTEVPAVPRADDEQHWDAPSGTEDAVVVDRAEGPVRVLAATVVHGTDGPGHAVAICALGDGTRCYARTDRPDAVAVVAGDGWTDAPAKVSPSGDGTNLLDL